MQTKGAHLIPETKRNGVTNALQKTFGVKEFEDIQEMTAGLSSALVLRIVVKGKPYLLRIITSTDAISDPTRQFACMRAAAEAKIAPPIRHLNSQERISITDFVEAQPFPLAEARTKLPELLSRLHSLPPFPKLMNYQEAMDGYLQKFQEAQILPASMTEELLKQHRRIVEIYPQEDADWVSCHNDLKPENILFDGERPWLVDWEAAFLNDRYRDLAIVANFVVSNEAEEAEYLRSYFGKAADEYQRARFFLACQLTHMAYFTVFMLIGSKGKPIDPNLMKADFHNFHDRIWAGEISLASDEAKLQYAWIHREQLAKNIQTKRFANALSLVSDYHKSQQ